MQYPLGGTQPWFETWCSFSWDTGKPPASEWDRCLFGGDFYLSIYSMSVPRLEDIEIYMYMYSYYITWLYNCKPVWDRNSAPKIEVPYNPAIMPPACMLALGKTREGAYMRDRDISDWLPLLINKCHAGARSLYFIWLFDVQTRDKQQSKV